MSKKKLIKRLSLAELDATDRVIRGEDVHPVGRLKSRLKSINDLLGGGYPRGRITEIAGREGTCKTLLAMDAIVQAQANGEEVLFVDVEHTFDPEWAKINGVNLSTLRVATPDSGEEAYEIIDAYLSTGELGVIVLDSIANIIPRAELEGDYGQANVGSAPRLNAQAMRKLTDKLFKSPNTALILINQLRGTIPQGGMGPTETTAGGKAVPYYAGLRLRTRRVGWVRRGDKVTGAEFSIEVVKSKITGIKDKSVASFQVDFSIGLDYPYDLLQTLLADGIVSKGGAWFTFNGLPGQELPEPLKFQGEVAVKNYLREHFAEFRQYV